MRELTAFFRWSIEDFHNALCDGRFIALKAPREPNLLTQIPAEILDANPLEWLAWMAVHFVSPPSEVVSKAFAAFPSPAEFYNAEFYAVFRKRLDTLVFQKNQTIAALFSDAYRE